MTNKIEKIKKLRNRSLILIGFSGGFRRAELISINYEDLDFVEEGIKITQEYLKQTNMAKVWLKVYPTSLMKNIVL